MAGPACKHTSARAPIGAAVRFPQGKVQHPQLGTANGVWDRWAGRTWACTRSHGGCARWYGVVPGREQLEAGEIRQDDGGRSLSG